MAAPAAARKRSRAAAEGNGVAATTKAPARKRAPAKRTPPPPPPRRSRLLVALAVLLVLGAAAAIPLSLVREDGDEAVPAGVSSDELVASVGEGPVYWAGPIAGRELELTESGDGTFVRYLPRGAAPGTSRLALTVATYPVANAYATAKERAEGEGMVARETRNGGLAVWSRAAPTSVYVAFAGVPRLIEVYAPDAAEARELALSGRVRPVR